MPTSVLLAVLAGAGLLALAPALVRRYDAAERIAAEREESQARVLDRKTRNNTMPGTTPINGPSADSASDDDDEDLDSEPDEPESESLLASETPMTSPVSSPVEPAAEPSAVQPRASSWERSGARRAASVRLEDARAEPKRHNEEESVASSQLRSWWQRRYRRVLFVLVGLNVLELIGVIVIGPGFWFGVAVSLALLFMFVRFLRMRVLRETRQRRTGTPKTTKSRRVYVPAQSDGGERGTPEIDDEPADDPVDEFIPGFNDDEEDDEPVPPPRRRSGGIRGRSYESPANL